MTAPVALIISGGIALARTLLQAYFQAMELVGRTEEEKYALYKEEEQKFKERNVDDLKDV